MKLDTCFIYFFEFNMKIGFISLSDSCKSIKKRTTFSGFFLFSVVFNLIKWMCLMHFVYLVSQKTSVAIFFSFQYLWKLYVCVFHCNWLHWGIHAYKTSRWHTAGFLYRKYFTIRVYIGLVWATYVYVHKDMYATVWYTTSTNVILIIKPKLGVIENLLFIIIIINEFWSCFIFHTSIFTYSKI